MTRAEIEALFSAATVVIQAICDDYPDNGKKALVVVNDLFTPEHCCFEAMYELLNAVPKPAPEDWLTPRYLQDLETLRAAYEADERRLSGLVADKVSKQANSTPGEL